MSRRQGGGLVVDKDLAKLLAQVLAAGWDARKCGNGHVLVTAPDGLVVSISSTPRGWTASKKLRAAMRRHGLIQ